MGTDPEAPPTYEEAVQPTSEPHTAAAPPPSYVPPEGYQPVPDTYLPPSGSYQPQAGVSGGYTTPAQPYTPHQYPAQQYPAQPYPAQHYPAQQYPAQQYTAQQYPAQQYPARHPGYNKHNNQAPLVPPPVVGPHVINRDPHYDSSSDPVHYRNVGILSMITCLFCCCPFGSIALYKVYQSSEYAKVGERQLAELYLKSAQKWALLGIIIGIATYIMLSVRNMMG